MGRRQLRSCAARRPRARALPAALVRLAATSRKAAKPGRGCRLVRALVREPDRQRSLLLSMRAEERVGAGLEHERDVMAGVRAPDHEVSGLDRAARDVPAVLEHRAGVGARELLAVRVDLGAGPLVTEGREARAVRLERQLVRMVDPVHGPQLLVVDLALVLNSPARDLDDLGAKVREPGCVLHALLAAGLERRRQLVPAQEARELRPEDPVARL